MKTNTAARTHEAPARAIPEGLCHTCLKTECALRAGDATVVQCEEFADDAPVRRPLKALVKTSPFSEPPATSAGLCVNCEERATCTLPRPECGVWHCESWR